MSILRTREEDGATRTVCNSDALSTSQVSVATSSTLILPANPDRCLLSIVNTGLTAVFIGNSGVTTSTGHRINAGETFNFNSAVTTAAIYGAAQTSAVLVTTLEC